ncbi:hypothetical protein O181_109480 [Austropuccinia psidii MF-1]|uniref:Integrase zinc-binding domain-containing protein n=1 Tax=Austropuccinia psidii MF-1 TaxID=1389203 RepID=A0A9Q3PQL6_9BASI|nr:hypothetical protein [Austropuccinia psidii MF-1]
MFIENFSQVASPLRRLTREDVDWDWDQKCEEAFHKLRRIVGEEITLKKLDYDKGAGKIKLAVDSSYIAAEALLTHEDKEGKDRPVLYESITFSKLESKYSQPKLELCGVARILKKLQTILWGQHFELQVDYNALIEMINTPCLPNAPMTRWVAFIQLFSFDLVHKPGKTFTMPDGLSRRPKNSEEEDEDAPEFDEEEDWIKPHPGFGAKNVNSLNFSGIQVLTKQEGFWNRMQEYLSKMKKPQSSKDEEFRRIKTRSSNFFLEEGQLKRGNNPNPQLVISSQEVESYILKSLHEGMGHRGENETYRRIKARFWWEGMKKSVKKWVHPCLGCQKRSKNSQREKGKSTATSKMFKRVSMDAFHIQSRRWKYMVVARDDFSGWPETVGLVKLTAKAVAEWFTSEWICRYGSPKEVILDGGHILEKNCKMQ